MVLVSSLSRENDKGSSYKKASNRVTSIEITSNKMPEMK